MTGFVQTNYGATAPSDIAPATRLIEQTIAINHELMTGMAKELNN